MIRMLFLALLLVPAAALASEVYSPGPGAVCDKVGKACFDKEGLSIGITKDEFGQEAADKVANSIEEAGDNWDPTSFTMSNGVSCNTTKKVCDDSSGHFDKQFTKDLFGEEAVENVQSNVTKASIEGHCKLYNKKSDNNKYKGACLIKQKMSADMNEYMIEFSNGDKYTFTQSSEGYQVQTPEGMNKNMATMTDHGDKAVFKWGKWRLTAKEN